ncbi:MULTISPECIES: formate dehydrogenase subunit delta [Comamonas]|uniref:formate dehydrogenase subunit delta n=1 Tax=Comamonas TaxID=283 RepID=UPI0015FCDAFD|nr:MULTISPECIES: formate dehydrogenase subunit delta [Comamonas]UUC92829.1 formate dehydrogenase subunit delta [Comamonas sp. C11]WEE76766.1 formate dehydrogenase subunit delta [Comamonas testosteroni]
MDVSNLIRMANRIAEFFEAMPEHEEALDGVAQHIQKFWEPRMRLRILAALNEPSEAAQLRPLVRDALHKHAAMLGHVQT